MFETTNLSFIPAIPSRNPDHTGSRFSVWYSERVIKHNRSGIAAAYVIGSSRKNAYIKGAPEKGTTVAEFFISESLGARVLEHTVPVDYVVYVGTAVPPTEEGTEEEVEIGHVLIDGERAPLSINMEAFVNALNEAGFGGE